MERRRNTCIYLLLPILLAVANRASPQQDNTLFLMHTIPQSNFTNPAVQITCPFYFGLPMLSTFHVNINSTGISYNSLSPGQDRLDIDKLVSRMHYQDFVSTEIHYTPVSLGFMYDPKQYYNFAWTEKIETKIFYPKKLLLLAKDGNTQYVGNGVKTRSPGLNTMYYREFSFGYSRKMDKNLILGAHAKVLFGLAGVFTRRKPVSLTTDAETYSINARWNPKIDAALPLEVSHDASGYVSNVGLGNINPLRLLLNFGNQGLATDLGVIYKYDDITLSGSILDLGMIWWHSQTTRFENSGSFRFNGATTDDIEDVEVYLDALRDSISNQMRVTDTQKGFITFLNPRVYFGGTYPVMERVKVGAHARTEFYPGRPIVGLTLSAMAFGAKGSSLALNYSIMNGSFMNVGLGCGWGGEQFQFFLLSDNVMVAFFPEKARNANLRFGFNFIIGCREKKKEVKIPKYDGCGCFWGWDSKTRRKETRAK